MIAALLFLAAPAPVTIHRLAFLVGENNGGVTRTELRYAVSDAESVAHVLSDLGGVQSEDEVVVREPSVDKLQSAWSEFSKRVQAARRADVRVEIVFYYSGHSDERGLLLGEQRFDYTNLRALLDSAPADVRIAILDSCDSGAFVRPKGGRRKPAFMSDASARASGHAFITSSSASEAAQESDKAEGSFFTTAFVSGLRGAADTNGDGRVTLDEAYQFAFHQTLAATERSKAGAQHASYDIQLSGSGDVVLTELRANAARIALAAPVAGHLTIRDEDDHLLVELDKHAGNEMSLALPPARYTLALESRAHFSAAEAIIAGGDTAHVGENDFHPTSAFSATKKGVLTLRPFALGLLPFATTNLGRDDVLNVFSLNLLAGRTPYLTGVEIGALFNYDLFDMRGVQLAGFGNIARDYAEGWQFAWMFNEARDMGGVQTASVNVARVFRGMQIGFINIGGDVTGMQLGLLNIARHVTGFQLGAVNIAGSVDGASFGAFSYVDDVPIRLRLLTTDISALQLELRYGSKNLYALLAAGAMPFKYGRAMAATGFGAELRVSRVFFDFEAMAGPQVVQVSTSGFANALVTGRFLIGVQILPRLAIIGGVSVNLAWSFAENDGGISPAQRVLTYLPAQTFGDAQTLMRLWPGFIFGLQI